MLLALLYTITTKKSRGLRFGLPFCLALSLPLEYGIGSMNIKQTISRVLLSGLFIGAFAIFGLSAPAYANENDRGCETETAILQCDIDAGAEGVQATGIWSILLLAINVLTALIGVAALGGIIYGSVLYTSAGGNVEQTKKAMGIITNVVIGVIAYALMFSFLNFIIPGGVFN